MIPRNKRMRGVVGSCPSYPGGRIPLERTRQRQGCPVGPGRTSSSRWSRDDVGVVRRPRAHKKRTKRSLALCPPDGVRRSRLWLFSNSRISSPPPTTWRATRGGWRRHVAGRFSLRAQWRRNYGTSHKVVARSFRAFTKLRERLFLVEAGNREPQL
jgi:hypothetical protein